jgi:hypothetical protein
MKSTKRDSAERKEKAGEKSSSRAIKKKPSLKTMISEVAEERSNKHRSYIKFSQDENTGAIQIGAEDGKDLFYLGTHDIDLVKNTIAQIGSICSPGDPALKISTIPINAALASIIEIDPKDSIELMLASQMTATHALAMEMSRRAMDGEQTLDGVDKNINFTNKLMRTFSTQVEALNKYRTKGQQKITVQHVNVNNGGQAVIGDVKPGGGGGDG